jgi:prolyl 4-hydroxylase
MHHLPVSTNYPWLPHNQDPDKYPTPDRYKGMVRQPLGDIKSRYDEYMQGCVNYYNEKKGGSTGNVSCWDTETGRIAMTLRQPQSMRNYTDTGFRKIRAPTHVFKLLKEFWEKNKQNRQPERWSVGNIYTNQQHIWNAARDTIEEWTGHRQAECRYVRNSA